MANRIKVGVVEIESTAASSAPPTLRLKIDDSVIWTCSEAIEAGLYSDLFEARLFSGADLEALLDGEPCRTKGTTLCDATTIPKLEGLIQKYLRRLHDETISLPLSEDVKTAIHGLAALVRALDAAGAGDVPGENQRRILSVDF